MHTPWGRHTRWGNFTSPGGIQKLLWEFHKVPICIVISYRLKSHIGFGLRIMPYYIIGNGRSISGSYPKLCLSNILTAHRQSCGISRSYISSRCFRGSPLAYQEIDCSIRIDNIFYSKKKNHAGTQNLEKTKF